MANLLQEIEKVDKKYNATVKVTFADITAYTREIKTIVSAVTGQCTGKDKCDILDLAGLSKLLFQLLGEINYTLLSLSGKCSGLRKCSLLWGKGRGGRGLMMV